MARRGNLGKKNKKEKLQTFLGKRETERGGNYTFLSNSEKWADFQGCMGGNFGKESHSILLKKIIIPPVSSCLYSLAQGVSALLRVGPLAKRVTCPT